MNKITTVLIFTICTAMMCGCLGTTYVEGPTDYGSGSVELLNHGMEARDFGYLYVSGDIENTGNTLLEHADVEVTFYDKNGVVVGESSTHVHAIWPGETGEFNACYQGGKQQLVTRTGDAYSIEIKHEIYDNRK